MRHQLGFALIVAAAAVAAACAPAADATPTTTATRPPVTATATPGRTPASPTQQSAAATPTAHSSTAPIATGGEPKYGGRVSGRLRFDIKTWDPMRNKTGDLDGRKQHNLVFSMPVVQPSTPEVATCMATLKPEAAESWKWLDDKTLEIKLRQGMKFHDRVPVNGREVTADDLAFSLDRALFKEPIQGVEMLSSHVTGVKATDRYTVRISTDGPMPVLVQSLLGNDKGAVILPKESAGPDGTWSDPRKSYIGSGPFMFKDWLPGVKVAHEKNPNYWKKGLPYLERVEFLLIVDESTALAALASGKLDIWSEEMSSTLAAAARKTMPQMQFQKCAGLAGYGPLFLQLKEPPFNDVRVRRALSMAVDRQTIVKTVLGGEGIESTYGPLDLNDWYLAAKDYPPETRKYLEYNPTEVRRLLAEAGYPNGLKDVELHVSTKYGGLYREMAEFLVASFTEAGIGIKPNWQVHFNWLADRDAEKWHGIYWARGQLADPYKHLAWLHSQTGVDLNWNRTNDPTLDSLIDQLLRTTDPAKAKEAAARIQHRVVDQAWAITVPQPADYSAFQPWVHGFNRAGYTGFTSSWLEVLWSSK